MAQDPFKPLDDGAIHLPSVEPGMNRIAPNSLNDSQDNKVKFLRSEDKSEEEEDSEILSRARKRLERCISAEAENRRDGLDDDKFYAGDQWPADTRARRNAEKRPCLTFNRFPTLIKQVTNDQRQNRPTIDYHPVGDRGDIDVARIYRGLVREIERQSHADRAYDTGYESAARKGWGYWRITTEYESEDTFDQVIRVKRIRNAYSVYIDPDVQEIDGSDMQYGFITEMIPREEFKLQWPKADPMPWNMSGYGDSNFKSWIDQHSLRIAEYYEIKKEVKELVLLENGYEGWKDKLDKDILNKYEVIATRRSLVPKVMWYKITAKDILERTEWPGKWVPIIRVIGDEIDIEGKPKLWGLVRQAKDAQRMYNYHKTSETERVALAPKAPFIIAEGQLEGYEGVWKEANNKSYAFLPYKASEIHGHMVPPPQRQPPVEVQAGIVSAAQGAAQDMMATTGVRFDATLNERTYDESGRALRELRRSGDIGSFNLIDNLMHSLRHTGMVFADLIPKIYNRPDRVITILRDDDTDERVKINPFGKPTEEKMDPETQRIMRAFDPTYGKYAVAVTIGPSYATRRIETAESMMDFLRAIPTSAPLIADLVAKNQDWEGSEEIAARLAKTLPPGMNTPEMRDVAPEVQALLVQLQNQINQLSQERQQLVAQINDRNQDRELARERINRTFEVQLLGVVQKAQAAANKLNSEDSRAEADGLRDMAKEVLDLYATLAKADQTQTSGTISNG